MSDPNDSEEVVPLDQLSIELKSGLDRCRRILRDCREVLAANSNEREPPEESDRTRLG
jgi:hypothetical protein